MDIDEETQVVCNQIYRMFSEANENCSIAFHTYLHPFPKDQKPVVDDDKINAQERDIESLCLQILLREKIFAEDLRKISGYLKMVENIERIGDDAYGILWMAEDIQDLKDTSPIKGMEEIISIVNSMVEDALNAFARMDGKLSEEIIRRDDEVDHRYWAMVQTLADLDQRKVITSKNAIYQAIIAKYLERIGDQATNVAEWVIYILNGYHKDKVII
jgi:phosphate transport system protein